MSPRNMAEYEAITAIVQQYLDGGKEGKSSIMKPAFHKEATVAGYVGKDLDHGPIQRLFDWTDKTGPSKDLVARIVSIEIVETIASVRVESEHWDKYRFSDFLNLLKVDGHWKIMNKVFHTW